LTLPLIEAATLLRIAAMWCQEKEFRAVKVFFHRLSVDREEMGVVIGVGTAPRETCSPWYGSDWLFEACQSLPYQGLYVFLEQSLDEPNAALVNNTSVGKVTCGKKF
jgi:hypothetical protein